MADPPLRFLHSEAILSQAKLEQFRTVATNELMESLRPGHPGALRTRADGTVLEGHHRVFVLREQGINVDILPREVVPEESEV